MTPTGRVLSPNNVANHLAKRAANNPDLEALVDIADAKRFSYRELNRRTDQVAN